MESTLSTSQELWFDGKYWDPLVIRKVFGNQVVRAISLDGDELIDILKVLRQAGEEKSHQLRLRVEKALENKKEYWDRCEMVMMKHTWIWRQFNHYPVALSVGDLLSNQAREWLLKETKDSYPSDFLSLLHKLRCSFPIENVLNHQNLWVQWQLSLMPVLRPVFVIRLKD
jgi:hypothetical protein